MKAGSAGSNPDATTKKPSATQPLRDFLRETGEGVAHLNTIVVGLDAVEKGYEKPDGLNISWAPKDRNLAAMKARRFVVEATLQKSSEALKEYIHSVGNFQMLDKVAKEWGGKTDSADKISDIGKFLLGDKDFLHVGACLLVHWRNRLVHKRSKASLGHNQKMLLKNNSKLIEEKFSGIDVERLLTDFERGRPTLKNVSTLITFSIKYVRGVDGKINNLSKEDLAWLIERYDLQKKIDRVKRHTPDQKVTESIIRLLNTEAPGLVPSYRKHYLI